MFTSRVIHYYVVEVETPHLGEQVYETEKKEYNVVLSFFPELSTP